jgi:predicted nucleic acid-binding protein
MIYVDTSVALAAVFAEPRRPQAHFWLQSLTSSALLKYEIMVRVNARGGGAPALAEATRIINQTPMLDMSEPILTRALQPFPVPVRTLDGLHLATMDFLRAHGQTIELATYDVRLAQAATALGFPLTAM